MEELLDSLPKEARGFSQELAVIARRPAPEHGGSTYGEPIRGVTPWNLYSRQDAYSTLNNAKEAFKHPNEILKRLEVRL